MPAFRQIPPPFGEFRIITCPKFPANHRFAPSDVQTSLPRGVWQILPPRRKCIGGQKKDRFRRPPDGISLAPALPWDVNLQVGPRMAKWRPTAGKPAATGQNAGRKVIWNSAVKGVTHPTPRVRDRKCHARWFNPCRSAGKGRKMRLSPVLARGISRAKFGAGRYHGGQPPASRRL